MSATSQELQAVDKQAQALRLRLAGISYADIAQQVGYKSASGALQAVKSALKKTLREPANELRTVELARLDEAQSAIWAKVLNGNERAIETFLRISRRRSELLGLNAPVDLKVSGSIEHNVTVENIDEIRAQRWAQVQGKLLTLPEASDTFTSVELDSEAVQGEKVTSL
jgi:hypothetical protein